MYYYLTSSLGPAAGASAELVKGRHDLCRYLDEADSKALDDAYAALYEAGAGDGPSRDEARLFEGVALDLLEHHRQAEERFRTLRDEASGELKERAAYHLAIVQLRKYDPDSLRGAAEALDELLGDGPESCARLENVGILLAHPIKAFALAARANAIAHQPIFWPELGVDQKRAKDRAARRQQKEQARASVEAWMRQVGVLTKALEVVVAGAPATGLQAWDEFAVRQLDSLLHNARGNMYLNSASYFYSEPVVRGAGWPELRSSYLQKARQEFEKCAACLTPGVETLANLAAVFLALGQPAEARVQAEAAIKLNPNYEYAYYRAAQAAEKEGDEREVWKILDSLPKKPAIPSFQKMFERHGVTPKAQ